MTRPVLLHSVPPPPWLRRLPACLASGVALAALSCSAVSQGLPAPPLPPALAPALPAALALVEQAARQQLPADARVAVEVGRVDPRLQPAPCERVEPHLLPGAPAWGRTRVGLRCARGPVAWSVFLPVTVQVTAPALVATQALAAGTRLEARHLGVAPADWGQGPVSAGTEPPLAEAEPALGRVLARPLLAGQPIRAGDLQLRQWFAAGDAVELRAMGAGFVAVGQGQALTPGHEGRPARVRTESGRIVIGAPSGERRMDVLL